MTTPTPIATFEDILAAMENNPQLQAALRQHVLDQEFLQLPAGVRELRQAIAELAQTVQDYVAATNARLERLEPDATELKAGQVRLEGDVTELKAGQARLEGDVTELKAGQVRLEGDVTELKAGQARLEGDVTELKAGQARLEGDVTELKAGQVRLEGDVTELKAGQARLEGDVTELKAGQVRLEGDVTELKAGQAELKAGQSTLEGNMNRLIGSDYERKAARRASRLAHRQLALGDMRVIYAITTPDNNELPQLLDRAVAAGRIDSDEADELESADLILAGSDQYVVAETSVTLDRTDVQRARNRADLLEKATTASARAAAIGAHALDSAVQYAAANDVLIMILPE